MPDLTGMAKEMFHLIHLNWDFQKKETKDNFKTLAKYTQKMVLEARIETAKEMQRFRWELRTVDFENKYIADLQSQLKALDGEE